MDIEILDDFWLEDYIVDINKLCDRAKAIYFEHILNDKHCNEDGKEWGMDWLFDYDVFDASLTPIEQIFNMAYHCYFVKISQEGGNNTFTPNCLSFIESLQKQVSIGFGDKKYIVDFVVDFSTKNANGSYIHPKIKDLKYAIELDGYDSHSSKKQINHDYNRQQELQLLGYKVIRFTGSQIYNSPYDCVARLVGIILGDIDKEMEKWRKNNE